MTKRGTATFSHTLVAEHAAAEYSVRTEGRGRAVDEWKERPVKPDNHWWDALKAGWHGLLCGQIPVAPHFPSSRFIASAHVGISGG